MVCPHCNKNSIPFFKFWLLEGIRASTCPECGKKSKMKSFRTFYLFFWLSFVVGYFIFEITWEIIILILVVALIIAAVLVYKFGKLMPVD